MLSKSAARAFFLGGTALTTLVFVGLTVDTMSQVPSRSHAEQLDAQVARGHELWNDNNCMGCHTLLGEGAYYAPELTKVYSRRGPEWIKVFIRDPEAMYPGRRKMVKYDFNDEELEALVAFFRWVEGIDTNGFPPEPDLKATAAAEAPKTAAERAQAAAHDPFATAPAKFKAICVPCHSLDGKGGNVGPKLDDVAARFDAARLVTWLSDPAAVKPGTTMPKLPLTEAEKNEIAAFLLGRQGGER